MSMEAYNVAVRISLVENVTRGLMMMSRHFKTTDAEAAVLEKRLKLIGKLAIGGAALAGAGAYGLSLFKKPIEEAMEYERRLGSLRQMGLGDAQIVDARKFVQATGIIGESMNDRLRLFVDAQGSFRQSGMSGSAALGAAKDMLPIMATYEAATKLLSGEKRGNAEMAMRSLNKTVEIMGGLTDTNRAKAIADGVFKASQSSGGMVDERQLKQFVAYGSSATNQLNLRTIFGGLEPLIGELGGSTSAVGLRTAYTRTNGMMSLPPKRMVAEMGRLGMLKAGTKQQNDDLARLQATDVIAYAQAMMARYTKAGITNRTDIERENAIIFGTNGSKIYNKIMSQMPVIQESLKAYDKAKGASGVLNDPRNRMLKAQMDLEAKEADLKLQIGRDILPLYVKGLEMVRNVLVGINTFATSHPGMFKSLVIGFAALSAVAVVAGGIMLVAAGFGAIALAAPMMAVLAPLLGPIALGLTAVAVSGVVLYKNWGKINNILTAINGQFPTLGPGMGAVLNFLAKVNEYAGYLNPIGMGMRAGQRLIDSADQWARAHLGSKGPNVIPAGSGKPTHIHTTINLDGRKVANAVSIHQVMAANRPNASSSGFDWSRGRPQVAGAAPR